MGIRKIANKNYGDMTNEGKPKKRRVRTPEQIERDRERNRQYYLAHREQKIAQVKAWKIAHDYHRVYRRSWSDEQKAKQLESHRRHYRANRAYYNEKSAQWKAEHADKAREINRQSDRRKREERNATVTRYPSSGAILDAIRDRLVMAFDHDERMQLHEMRRMVLSGRTAYRLSVMPDGTIRVLWRKQTKKTA